MQGLLSEYQIPQGDSRNKQIVGCQRELPVRLATIDGRFGPCSALITSAKQVKAAASPLSLASKVQHCRRQWEGLPLDQTRDSFPLTSSHRDTLP